MAKASTLAESKSDILNVAIENIDVDPAFNIRHDSPELQAHVREIANSIIERGYLRTRPLTVRTNGDRLVVSDGHLRLAAVKLAISEGAEIVTLPCVLEPRGTNEADRIASIFISNNGLSHTVLEKAEGVKKLESYGWDDTKISGIFGVSVQTLNNWLLLASAPEKIRQHVADGEVSASNAVLALHTNKSAEEATQAITNAVAKAKEEGRKKATSRQIAVPAERKRKPRATVAGVPVGIEIAAPTWETLSQVRLREMSDTIEEYKAALLEILRCGSLQEARGVAEGALRGVVPGNNSENIEDDPQDFDEEEDPIIANRVPSSALEDIDSFLKTA